MKAEGSLSRSGRILSIAGGKARVELEAPGACAGCGSRALCMGLGERRVLEIPAPPTAQVGDTVTLTADASALVTNALLAYLLPPTGLVLGALALAAQGDLAAAGGASLGLLAALWFMRRLARWRLSAGRDPGNAY